MTIFDFQILETLDLSKPNFGEKDSLIKVKDFPNLAEYSLPLPVSMEF
jgi:hypothetical protein